MNIGYQTSKNRVSMGLSLTDERAFKLRRLAADLHISIAEQVGRLVDAEWSRTKGASHPPGSSGLKEEKVA